MADETSTTPAATPSADATQAAPTTVTPPADATGTNSGASDRTFTQADLDRIVAERLERANEKAKKDAAKAQADAEAKVLAEQGKYKELFEKQQADLLAAQAEAKSAATKLLQQSAAGKAGFPIALSDRLKGESEEEMIADAKSILDALPKAPPPNINAGAGNGAAPKAGQISDAEKVELAARFGVDPKYM